MRYCVILLLLALQVYAASVQEQTWRSGETFLGFLDKHKIPQNFYYDLAPEDKELATEVLAGSKYHVLTDEKTGELLQVLIPINEQTQIHIFKDTKLPNGYGFTTMPIRYFEKQQAIAVELNSSPYNDIIKVTQDSRLASEFSVIFKRSFSAKKLQKQDKIALVYNRKYRLGKPFGSPEVLASFVESRGKPYYIFAHKDGNYYDERGESVMQFLLTAPLAYSRISSSFSNARKHPILGYKRPHLGIDYAAPKGTPIRAAGDGVISYVGNKGGYGKTVIINHEDGLRTLYAHLNGYAKGIRSGKTVKQGNIIAYVGSSGMSTGPHLHLGLYKNGQAINPAKNIASKKKSLKKQEMLAFKQMVASYQQRLQDVVAQGNFPFYDVANEYIANQI